MRNINSSGQLTNTQIQWASGAGANYSKASFGLRPVFIIKPEAKITSGSGTSSDPFIIEN